MAKKKTSVALTKKEIDQKILEFLRLDEEIKERQSRVRELKAVLTGQFQLPDEQEEVVQGFETQLVKIPVNNGRNNFNIDLLRPFLKAIGRTSQVIKTVEVIDVEALNELVKDGELAEEVLNTCRVNNWTFRTMFERIEAAAQATTEKLTKAVQKVTGRKSKKEAV